ncbi:glycosyl transferase family 39 [Emticicia oligotrophica DSM 17448]|uniref:Glycosyl transferase family 39 n=1 Tax=Emticicia oligotrophica (strain DSM 17448 / CIP 109782 / MTCC 6937 / GPTSA100-15) TaxID=929562 RepID=A0ABM5MZF2_EMTOG|nr:glycosyltransferase family 39 protein [Emticicia oligotrophica]AFK02561.1 glycosyl transferase family 39 [Emticicia oligotrophica DSM 17448]
MLKQTTKLPYIILLGLIFYFPFLGGVHLFDWDEINFAESAREMILTGNYSRVQIDFKPFWEKPPLFFWMQTIAMHIFGVNEFAARFPNACIGVITLITLFIIGKKLKDSTFGFIWSLMYLGAFTPHLYFKSGIIDPTFNLCIFLGIYFFFTAKIEPIQYLKSIIFSGFFIGLAILTKGPVAGLIWGLTIFFYGLNIRFKNYIKWKEMVIFGISCLLITSIWFANELFNNGPWFFKEFITYQIRLFSTPDAGHGQPFYYHFVVVLIGCFPISIFAIRAFTYNHAKIDSTFNELTAFVPWMKTTFWVVMILFSIVTTKIVHYSSMAYFPVSFLAAKFIYDWLNERATWNKWVSFGLISIGGILSLILAAVPLVGMNTRAIIPYIKDPFAVKNLEAVVEWHTYEIFIGILYFAVILYAVLVLRHKRKEVFIYTLSLSTAICLFLFGAMVVPKIERYTQGAAIDFYESKRGQEVYVHVLGFKSYAHLFYFQKPVSDVSAKLGEKYEDWLLNGKVDKPVFFVTKFDRYDEYRNHPNLELIKEQNGFVFLKRKNL